jgi:Protein of unknown function (DUF5672)/SEC-C motif
MLSLPSVTLVCIDCANHDLALAALEQCMQKCAFARVLFITDRDYAIDGIECVRIPTIDSRDAYSRFVIKDLHAFIETDFALLVQWDGFVVNAAAWSDDFLEYDYIGAKWIFHDDGHNVGNGGFSLRSKRLLEALRDPHVVPGDENEDDAICRTYRAYLEQTHGVCFAPEAVADRFAFEASYWTSPPFGFHGLFNFWMFLDRAGLAAFLAMATPRILGSVQCLRLAKNYLDLKRNDEALMVLRRIADAYPDSEATQIIAKLEDAAIVAPASRNAACPCGSGKRYKECHGKPA